MQTCLARRWPHPRALALSPLLLAFVPLLLAFTGCRGEVPTGGAAGTGGSNPAATGGAPATGDGIKRIVILTNGDDPFWDACEAGAREAEQKLDLAAQGYSLSFERADFTDQGQIDKLKQYKLQNEIVAVGISVYNPESLALAREMRDLQEKGVKVVTIDGDVSREQFRDARYAYLGTDNFVGGRELGVAAKALAPQGSNYAFFVGSTSAANAIARMDGFVEGVGASSKEVERLEDGGDRPKARANVESALDRHSEIDMLVGIWAYNTPQIVQVVKDRDIRATTKVCCFDAAEASIREMAAGNVDVMVVQNPYQMGYDGVRILKAIVENDKSVIDSMYPQYGQGEEGDVYRTELRVVVPAAGSPITRELFQDSTEFYTLPEFEQWLADRGLVSS